MAKFKVGDRVKFLSSTGKGIIRSFASTNVANVEDESGFEIPTLVSELLLDACEDKAGAYFCSKDEKEEVITQDAQEETAQAQNDYSDERISKLFLNRLRHQTSQGVYLCFVPHEQKWLVYGDIDVYLVNYTNNRIIYSILLSDSEKGFVSKDFGTLESEEKVLLDTIEREETELWKRGCVQLMFHNDEAQSVLQPVSCEMKVRTNRFFTEGSFTENAFFSDKAIVYPVCSMVSVGIAMQGANDKLQDKEQVSEVQTVESREPSDAKSLLSRHLTDRNCAEVDLHIERLVEDCTSLSNDEMLRVQLSYAIKCLDEAIVKGLGKLIFIHGVGQGILKKALCKELDAYSNVHYFDAPMSKYGVGATEVYIGKAK